MPMDASAPALQLQGFPSESHAAWRDVHTAPAAGDLKILKLEIGTESPENSRRVLKNMNSSN